MTPLEEARLWLKDHQDYDSYDNLLTATLALEDAYGIMSALVEGAQGAPGAPQTHENPVPSVLTPEDREWAVKQAQEMIAALPPHVRAALARSYREAEERAERLFGNGNVPWTVDKLRQQFEHDANQTTIFDFI